jgi:hypothetical protein
MKMAKEFAGPDGFLYCIVNNDHQACLKKGYSFMPLKDRLSIIGAIKYVDEAVASIDTDRTVCETIRMLCKRPGGPRPTHCANGGDVLPGGSPEDKVCKEFGIEMVFGLGDKIQSSSWIISAAQESQDNIKAQLIHIQTL